MRASPSVRPSSARLNSATASAARRTRSRPSSVRTMGTARPRRPARSLARRPRSTSPGQQLGHALLPDENLPRELRLRDTRGRLQLEQHTELHRGELLGGEDLVEPTRDRVVSLHQRPGRQTRDVRVCPPRSGPWHVPDSNRHLLLGKGLRGRAIGPDAHRDRAMISFMISLVRRRSSGRGVGPHPADRVLAHVAVAPEQLEALVEDAHRRSVVHHLAIATVGMSRAPSRCFTMQSSTKTRPTRVSVAASASLNLVFWNPNTGRPKACRSLV